MVVVGGFNAIKMAAVAERVVKDFRLPLLVQAPVFKTAGTLERGVRFKHELCLVNSELLQHPEHAGYRCLANTNVWNIG